MPKVTPSAAEKREQMERMNALTTEQLDADLDARKFAPQPLVFDFNEEEPEPDWIVAGIVAREEVCLLSGDTGAAKSIVTDWLIAQSLEAGEWLGFRTNIARVTVIDEENSKSLAKARLRAVGMQNESLPNFRYFCRQGCSVGDGGDTDAWLEAHLEEFRPDLLVIDTLLAATATTETNDNDAASRMMRFLRSLASKYECAIVAVHHERKQSKDGPSSASQATLGARAWVGQSDAHVTLTVESDYEEEPSRLDDENVWSRRSFKLRTGEKVRVGGLNHPQRIVVTSEKTPNQKLVWMMVDNEGPIDGKTKAATLATAIAKVVERAEESMTTSAIAGALGMDAQDRTFKRALKESVDLGYLISPKRGTYDFGSLGSLNV